MRQLITLLLTTSCVFGVYGQLVDQLNVNASQIIQSGSDIVGGLITYGANNLDDPLQIESLLDAGEFLVVLPFGIGSSVANKICANVLAVGGVNTQVIPDISKMNFILLNDCKRRTFPLLEADKMWNCEDFHPEKKVVILATGWTSNVNDSEPIDDFSKAFNCRGDVNFVALDAAHYIDTLYTWSALNTEEIGRYFADGLVQLAEIIPIENVHLIGHSLGAHIVGYAGRYFKELTGQSISRITGLDPAKPCFNEGQVLSGLQRGDAKFIDIIHSNVGIAGQRNPLGDADYYPAGLNPTQPGCSPLDVGCSHARSWQYFEESIYPGNERNFLAVRCTSLTSLKRGKCPGPEYPMGYATNTAIEGDYFLDVNSEPPYGQNATSNYISPDGDCGKCP